MPKIISNKSNVDLDYPVVRPSLDLDFTQEELDPRITFSRGSTGTRVNRNRLIETVSANQPRFDYDPVTGECKGLLIEESRQNLLTYSEDFSNVIWNKSNVSVSTDQITSPDQTLTADKIIIGNGVSISHIITQTSSIITAGSTVTFSIFAKYIDWSNIRIQVFGNTITADTFQARFNIQTGTSASSGNGGSATILSNSITAFPNGWYRCSVTGIVNTTDTSVRTRIAFMNSGGGTIFSGDGVSSYYLWGAQLEAGAFPTSYIPNTASTVTRSADLASMTGTNFSSWYNQSEGTILTSSRFDNISSTNQYITQLALSSAEYYALYREGSSGRMVSRVGSSGINQAFFYTTTTSTTSKTQYKQSLSYSLNNFSGNTNGDIIYRDISGILPSSLNSLGIGGSPYTTSVQLNGTISRLTYYPRALKPSQLQYLTQ